MPHDENLRFGINGQLLVRTPEWDRVDTMSNELVQAWSALPPEADRKGQQSDLFVRRSRRHPALRPGHTKPLGPKEKEEIRPHLDLPDPNVKILEHKPLTPAALRTDPYAFMNDIRGERIAKGPVHPKADDINVNDLAQDRMYGDLTFPSNRIHGGLHPISVGDPTRHPATGNDLGLRDSYGGNPVQIHGDPRFTTSLLERVPANQGILIESDRGNDCTSKKINTPKVPMKYEQRVMLDGVTADPEHLLDKPIMPYNTGNQFGYSVTDPRRVTAVPTSLFQYQPTAEQNQRLNGRVVAERHNAAVGINRLKHHAFEDVVSRQPNQALEKIPRPRRPHFVPGLDQPELMAADMAREHNKHVEHAPGISKKMRHPSTLVTSFNDMVQPTQWSATTVETGPRAEHGDAVIESSLMQWDAGLMSTSQHWVPEIASDADPRRDEMVSNPAEMRISNHMLNNSMATRVPVMVDSRF